MSGYTIFMSQNKNGTNTNSRPEVKIRAKYFIRKNSRVKTSYVNVRTKEIKKERKKAKQETGVKFKRLMQ